MPNLIVIWNEDSNIRMEYFDPTPVGIGKAKKLLVDIYSSPTYKNSVNSPMVIRGKKVETEIVNTITDVLLRL